MRNKSLLLFIPLLFMVLSSNAQATGTLSDARDGKTYKTVLIGNQIWMAENLNYQTKEGSWCYDDSLKNCNIYGRLYNLETAKNVCPKGWHLPEDSEWKILTDFLEGDTIAGSKMKSKEQWLAEYTDLNNNSGFNALPAGSKTNNDGPFWGIGENAYFWSATDNDFYTAWERCIYDNSKRLAKEADHYTFGYSVRCIQD